MAKAGKIEQQVRQLREARYARALELEAASISKAKRPRKVVTAPKLRRPARG